MTTERRASVPERWWLWPVLLLLGLLAWRTLSLGLADHFARTAPDRALGWRAAHPEALLHAAESRLGAGDPATATLTQAQAAAAAALAQAALVADPLDGRAYRVLGQLADDRGDSEQALELYSLATQRAPRDVPARLWMVRHGLRTGDADLAIRHLDQLMRVQPELIAKVQPALVDLAGRPEAHPALAERLRAAPPWRSRIMAASITGVADVDVLGALVERLRVAPGRLTASETKWWVDRLAAEGRWGQAYLTWASNLPVDQLQRLENVFNGGFELPIGESGFDWRTERATGVRSDRREEPGATGRFALRLAFSGQRTGRWAARQMLALPPGRYRLTGRARAERLQSGRGLSWTVTCATGGAPLGLTAPLHGDQPWAEFAMEFEVPAQGCGGQWLSVGVPVRIAAELRVTGQAWFDDLKILRIP